MATYFSVLASKTPKTEECGGLQIHEDWTTTTAVKTKLKNEAQFWKPKLGFLVPLLNLSHETPILKCVYGKNMAGY